MPPDLPASLVAELLGWVACDECGGEGGFYEDSALAIGIPGGVVPTKACRCPHTVVMHEGRHIHADPERVELMCSTHGLSLQSASSVTDRCIEGLIRSTHRDPGTPCNVVLRPVVPIDLEGA